MRYFFLLGCHRSGTTMLQLALNRHSKIAIPAETKYFSAFLGHSYRCQVNRLSRINSDLQINLAPPSTAIEGKESARRFFADMAGAYVARVGKGGDVWFGEKTPVHCGYVSRIRDLFPDAKLIWLYRDGRDVAASMRKVDWLSPHLGVNMLIWLFYHRKQMRLAHDSTAPAIFVKYEDLVAHPEKELDRVTDFLELPFEPSVSRGSGNREGVLDWEYSWKSKAFERITTDCVGVWRRDLSATEVEFLEALGGCALQKLGYELVTRVGKSRLRKALSPRMWLEVIRFLRRIPCCETTNQMFGRAVCCGSGCQSGINQQVAFTPR